MKYNVRYRKSSTVNLAPVAIDPSPMTREGTRSLVERFYAMRRDDHPEVWAGGRPAVAVSTSPIPPGPKKIKSDITYLPSGEVFSICISCEKYKNHLIDGKCEDCRA